MLRNSILITILLTALCTYLPVNAEETTYRLNVGDFSELQVIDALNVIHHCNADSAGTAVFTTTPDVVKAIMFTNSKGKLKIERNLDIPLTPEHFPTVTVYSTYINSVENFNDSTILVESPTPGASIRAFNQGNGRIDITNIHTTRTQAKIETGKGSIRLQGRTQSIKLNNLGTGCIDASALEATEGSVSVIGTGTIECNVSKELSIKGMGPAKVYIVGDPKISRRTVGPFKIEKMDELK